jgi:hypothetical protein
MKNSPVAKISLGILLCSLFLLTSCGARVKPQSSTDASALQAVVKISIPIKAVRWEIFHYPEQDGGFMTNIDSTILIAEIEPANSKKLENRLAPIKIKWLNPNDARVWISPAFRTMLSSESIDLKKYSCAAYQTTGMTTGDRIDGFTCELDGRILLYLLLDERT